MYDLQCTMGTLRGLDLGIDVDFSLTKQRKIRFTMYDLRFTMYNGDASRAWAGKQSFLIFKTEEMRKRDISQGAKEDREP